MKSIQKYVFDRITEARFKEIDAEIILEKLSDPKLIALAKQLRSFGSKNKDRWNNMSFSGIFGHFNMPWDKVAESDWKYFEPGDPNAKKMVRKIVSKGKNQISGIALLVEADDKNSFKYLIAFENVIDFKKKNYWSDKVEPGKMHADKQYEMLGLLDAKDSSGNYKYATYVLDFNDMQNDVWRLKRERSTSKEGRVLQGNEEYYAEVARQNKDRYSKLIAKMKAEKAAKKDTLAQDAQDIINEVTDFAVRVAKDPIKYADCSWEVCKIVAHAYGTDKDVNGANILKLLANYLDLHMSLATGNSFGFQRREYDEAKKKLGDMINDLRKKIDIVKERIK